ncbi:MAG: bifunctional riboflavin kinase/FAD synthetase [Clostridia bacterium]|nr:bifunctional riboflavin kinase/FAD synthetase [Clostridia bacterium]
MVDLVCISLPDRTVVDIPEKTIVCLGNFDGVHMAHRELLKQAERLQKETFPDAARCVFSFHEPSWATISKENPKFLSTEEERLSSFFEAGIEYAILCSFGAIRDHSPEQFVKEVLLNGCHCVAAVCGFNYRFGKMGAGTPNQLRALLNTPVAVQNEVVLLGDTVSSSRIRALLSGGDVKTAAMLLGAPYSLTAKVIHGKALGKQLGFPTINQEIPPKKMIPRCGVYLTSCRIDGVQYYGVTNIGVRPTVDRVAVPNCETHLLDVEKDLYDKTVTVSFLDFLRPEKRFSSVEELCSQMQRDIDAARRLLPH